MQPTSCGSVKPDAELERPVTRQVIAWAIRLFGDENVLWAVSERVEHAAAGHGNARRGNKRVQPVQQVYVNFFKQPLHSESQIAISRGDLRIGSARRTEDLGDVIGVVAMHNNLAMLVD